MALTKISRSLLDTGISDSSDATAITIDSSEKTTFSGDVEVGTTAPKINLKNTDTSIVADQSLGVIEIESTDGSTGSAGTIAKLDIAASGAFDGSGHGSDFRFTTGATNQSGSIALSEVMRITSTGRVGIGKTDPNYHLVVGGTNPKIQIYDSAGSGQTNLYFGDSGSNLAGYIVYQHSDNVMRLGANATEIMRIASTGNVAIGTTDTADVRFRVDQNENDDHTAFFKNTCAANAMVGITFKSDNTVNAANKFGFQIDDNGSIRFEARMNGGIANYQGNDHNYSDERLKENITDSESTLDIIKNLKVRNFKYKDQEDNRVITGLIAQEVELVDSTLVSTATDGYKGIYTTDLYHKMLKAIQEQQTQIEALQSEINLLKGE